MEKRLAFQISCLGIRDVGRALDLAGIANVTVGLPHTGPSLTIALGGELRERRQWLLGCFNQFFVAPSRSGDLCIGGLRKEVYGTRKFAQFMFSQWSDSGIAAGIG